MKPNVHAGRLQRRVRRVGSETRPEFSGLCSLLLFFSQLVASLYPPYDPYFKRVETISILELTSRTLTLFAFITVISAIMSAGF